MREQKDEIHDSPPPSEDDIANDPEKVDGVWDDESGLKSSLLRPSANVGTVTVDTLLGCQNFSSRDQVDCASGKIVLEDRAPLYSVMIGLAKRRMAHEVWPAGYRTQRPRQCDDRHDPREANLIS